MGKEFNIEHMDFDSVIRLGPFEFHVSSKQKPAEKPTVEVLKAERDKLLEQLKALEDRIKESESG